MQYLTEQNIQNIIKTEEQLRILSASVVCAIYHSIPFFGIGKVPLDTRGCVKEEYKNVEDEEDEIIKEEIKVITKAYQRYIDGFENNDDLLIGHSMYTFFDLKEKYVGKRKFFQNYLEKFDFSFFAKIISSVINWHTCKRSFEEKLHAFISNSKFAFDEIEGTIFKSSFERHVIYILHKNGIKIENSFDVYFNEDR